MNIKHAALAALAVCAVAAPVPAFADPYHYEYAYHHDLRDARWLRYEEWRRVEARRLEERREAERRAEWRWDHHGWRYVPYYDYHR